jgi:hypothetical protein
MQYLEFHHTVATSMHYKQIIACHSFILVGICAGPVRCKFLLVRCISFVLRSFVSRAPLQHCGSFGSTRLVRGSYRFKVDHGDSFRIVWARQANKIGSTATCLQIPKSWALSCFSVDESNVLITKNRCARIRQRPMKRWWFRFCIKLIHRATGIIYLC